MEEVAKVAKDIVIERTSRGFGVDKSEGKKERLKALSPRYKKQRRRLKKAGKLSGETTPNKSNLTQTRQMLNSVASKALTGVGIVYIDNSEARDKAEYQEDAGRKFMNLSKTETKQLVKLIEEQISNDIKKKGL
jgi:hypothetical protein